MVPTVDEIQQAINRLIELVLEISKDIAWQKEYSHDDTKNKGKSSACTWMEKKEITYDIKYKEIMWILSIWS